MTPQLRNLRLEDTLIVDIETASRYKDIKKENPDMLEVFQYKRRDRETSEIPPEEKAIEMYNKEAALSAVYGQIVCITVGSWKKGKLIIHSFTGDESKIIKNFVKLVKSRSFKLVGYNLRFDIPYIRKRALHNNISEYLTPQQGLDVGVKPWDFDEIAIDLMNIMKGVGWANESLEETCLLLNVQSPKKGECSGAKVSEFFHRGKIDEIVTYCEDDVRATAEVFLKLKEF